MYQSPAWVRWVTPQPVREDNINTGLLAPMLILVLSLDFKCTSHVALVMFSNNVFCLILIFFFPIFSMIWPSDRSREPDIGYVTWIRSHHLFCNSYTLCVQNGFFFICTFHTYGSCIMWSTMLTFNMRDHIARSCFLYRHAASDNTPKTERKISV